jgi:hypothetical protein
MTDIVNYGSCDLRQVSADSPDWEMGRSVIEPYRINSGLSAQIKFVEKRV